MRLVAALILSFWAACYLGASIIAFSVFAAPGSRSSLLLPFALLALAVIFWRAAMSLWRSKASAPRRLREAAALTGPLLAIMMWDVSPSGQLLQGMLTVLVAWGLFGVVVSWLAKRIARQFQVQA